MNDIFIVLWEPNQQQNPSYLSEAKSRAVRKRHEARAASKQNATPRRNGANPSLNTHRQTAKVTKTSAIGRSVSGHPAKPKPKPTKTASMALPHPTTTSREKSLICDQPRLDEQPTLGFVANSGTVGIAPMMQQPVLGAGSALEMPMMEEWQDLYPYDCDFSWFNPGMDAANADGCIELMTSQDWAMVNRLNCPQMYLGGM